MIFCTPKKVFGIQTMIVLIPQIRAVARSVVGRYTPEQLYSTKRDAIQNEIYEETQKVVELMTTWGSIYSTSAVSGTVILCINVWRLTQNKELLE